MNNSSIFTADRMTHLKIVVISLIASIAVLAIGITARMGAEPGAAQASAPLVVKATSHPRMASVGTAWTIR